ncbi:hypothetical protein JIN85_06680 [Luteolibacter pohnpeiensis]|uniref:Uncharacterized protein n=1 Tax=Luteolibacter pohnpeiensis TaxID=454153 RepID=A0A934S4C9_9BACT|nr:hypothetical protein [Luteolibacter pohnpeiensis]
MTDSENDPLRGLLSEFALGPAWARGETEPRPPRQDGRDRDSRPPRRDDQGRGQRRPFQGRDGRNSRGGYDRSGPPRREEIPPAEGVRVTLLPDAQAIHLIGREVHQVARVYPLFDVARILLAERARCRAVFELEPSRPPMYAGILDESLFLTKEEAVRHLWNSDLRKELLEEEIVEVDPPNGNFQSVARCGISGEWLGPPNFHAYQPNLRRLHRERFSNMPFEVYAAKVRTERGEEAVNAWLESMKQKTRWRLKSETPAPAPAPAIDSETASTEEETEAATSGPSAEEAPSNPNPWMDDQAEAERALTGTTFGKVFKEVHKAEVSAALPGKNLSPSLLTTLKMAGSHARKHPAILIPAVCRALEAEHLPVFKRQGKLHTGPARPHALAPNAVLAARPAAMVEWIRANKPAKLDGFWKAILPEGMTEPSTEYAADLFWLLNQGHILLYTDDTIVVQEPREPTPPKKPKAKKSPKAPADSETAETTEGSTASAPEVGSEPSEDPLSVAETGVTLEAAEAAELAAESEPTADAQTPEPSEAVTASDDTPESAPVAADPLEVAEIPATEPTPDEAADLPAEETEKPS